jgi:flagellar hook assembly protein FlgD
LIKAFPNPFNSVTVLSYSNLKGGEIEIFNISGQLVRTFHIDTRKEGKIIWDATDAMGNKVSSGIYFARARTINNTQTIKLVYLK